jgi:two-component system, NtrC family, sensor kinase
MPLRERFARLSIRGKLLVLALLPLALALPLLALGLAVWADEAFDRLLVAKVRADLAIANGYFERVLVEVGSATAAAADSRRLLRELPDRGRFSEALIRLKTLERLDLLELRDGQGRLVASSEGELGGAPLPELARAPAGTRLALMEPDELARVAPALAARVPVPLVATRNAAPTDRQREDRAMLVLSSAPLRDDAGREIGTLTGGVLLNRNLGFIDHINEIVYPEGSLPFGSRGTATLFLDDVRISTNVRLFAEAGRDGARAIGTRVSQRVRDEVLGRGATWLGRAFVVSDWYVSGYQPLADASGRRVGMLYVGFLERPFTIVKYGMLAAIGLLMLAVLAVAAAFSLRLARDVFAPLERMARTMDRAQAGALDARVGDTGRSDEIGRLAGHLDRLLDAVGAHTRELDAKVAERTRELADAQQQLVRSEKLAAIGQLTAGIAHEVNNPIAVIQGNLDLARELLGDQAHKVHAELALVDQQIERMRLIVTQLLQFARPTDFAGYVEPLDLARVVDECLVLVNHLLAKSEIRVERDLRATRRPEMNRQELQQVLVNLLVNALHAMPGGGTLTLASRDAGDAMVELAVSDTGPGIDPELQRELFKPFVTRKKDGTGLGLWISRSIVERYGGELSAAGRDDGVRGARFTLRLKA